GSVSCEERGDGKCSVVPLAERRPSKSVDEWNESPRGEGRRDGEGGLSERRAERGEQVSLALGEIAGGLPWQRFKEVEDALAVHHGVRRGVLVQAHDDVPRLVEGEVAAHDEDAVEHAVTSSEPNDPDLWVEDAGV